MYHNPRKFIFDHTLSSDDYAEMCEQLDAELSCEEWEADCKHKEMMEQVDDKD